MGLDFTIGKWTDEDFDRDDGAAWMKMRVHAPSWAYSGFHRFRERLADEVGIPLNNMKGFHEHGKPWAEYADEDLLPLLNHSDCDGQMTPAECERVAPRLREIVGRWEEGDYDRMMGERLAGFMERCIEADKPLVFT